LSPKYEKVLRMRYGIGLDTEHTLEEIGLVLQTTRERVRQIELKSY
jgi:RNA polymerase primary sigma factor